MKGCTAFSTWGTTSEVWVATTLGVAILLYAWMRAPLELKLFVLFCAGLLAASLKNPLDNTGVPAWQGLLSNVGGRYWFFPMAGFIWVVIWATLESHHRVDRIAGGIVLLGMSAGMVHDWKDPAFYDTHFARYEKQFDSASAGDVVTMPEYPGWTIRLIKHR